MQSRTPWRAKLEKDQMRELVNDPKGKGKMLIPKPLDVDAMIRRVEKGKLTTIDRLRAALAKKFGADTTCPLCTGIFLKIVAETAEEDLSHGLAQVTPYWRVLKSDGGLNEKFPGGEETQAACLAQEGHDIEPGKGNKPPKVKGWEKRLQEL